MDHKSIRKKLFDYYRHFSAENDDRTLEDNSAFRRQTILDLLDKNFKGHEKDSAYRLKAYQYETIADNFEPMIFPELPFYFELATKYSFSDGTAYARGKHPGGWTLLHDLDILTENDSESFRLFEKRKKDQLYCICGPRIELMHYGFNYENLLEKGLSGIYAEASSELENCVTDNERDFIESAMRGLLAVKRIAEKFSEKAVRMLANETKPELLKNLSMIAKSAKRVPWERPQSFYEGLNMLAFFREVTGSLEGIGVSSLGRPDKYLWKLYEADIKSGRITRDEAYELICGFLLIWDCHHDRDKLFSGGAEHELECTLVLGGCDEKGGPVANELTKLFLDAYSELDCIYPKFQCRFSKKSPAWYLDLVASDILNGRANYLLANDDMLIASLVNSGKQLTDARNYLVSGCWDIFCSLEHRPGGEYLNLLRPVEWAFYPKGSKDLCGFATDELGVECRNLSGDESFDEVYRLILENIDSLVRLKVGDNNRGLELFAKADPLPFYSACMGEPIKRRRDVNDGGAKYSPGSIYYVGFANLADSLMAIKRVCFDEKLYSLSELMTALRNNFEGFWDLRRELLSSDYFCDGKESPESFAIKLHNDLCDIAGKYRTRDGEPFDAAYLVYVEFMRWGNSCRATPDGRYNGELLSHGIGPSRNREITSLTSIANSAGSLDLTRTVNSVLNLVVPSTGMDVGRLHAIITALGSLGLQSIHLSCVSKEELLDAKFHPERHQDLIVRVCGFSAKFVSMSEKWQDEFISRNFAK